MEWLFWAALLFVAYTYAGYPLAIQWLSRWRPAREHPWNPGDDESRWPGWKSSVERNEEEVITNASP